MRHCVDPDWVKNLMPMEREFVARQLNYKFVPNKLLWDQALYEDVSKRLHIGKLIELIGSDYYKALYDQDGVPVKPHDLCLALWQALTWKWFGNARREYKMDNYKGYW